MTLIPHVHRPWPASMLQYQMVGPNAGFLQCLGQLITNTAVMRTTFNVPSTSVHGKMIHIEH